MASRTAKVAAASMAGLTEVLMPDISPTPGTTFVRVTAPCAFKTTRAPPRLRPGRSMLLTIVLSRWTSSSRPIGTWEQSRTAHRPCRMVSISISIFALMVEIVEIALIMEISKKKNGGANYHPTNIRMRQRLSMLRVSTACVFGLRTRVLEIKIVSSLMTSVSKRWCEVPVPVIVLYLLRFSVSK